MKFADLTLSLLVGFGPAASQCNPADGAPAPDNAQSLPSAGPSPGDTNTHSAPGDPAQVEPPPPEGPQAEAPPTDVPQAEPPPTEGPQAEAPPTDVPQAEPPPPEGPQAEAPPTDVPQAEPPPPEGPQAEAPPPEAPQGEMLAPPPGSPAEPATAPELEPPDFVAGSPSAPPGDFAPGETPIGANGDGYDDADSAALADFRGALDPYGTWTDDASYGTVWVPSPEAVGPAFQPYVTAGHWTYEGGWVWASDYPWGWAPFHYGRWILRGPRGWSWVPGRAYRGAWVDWSTDAADAYVGWAPTGPAFVWVGGAPVARRGAPVAPRWAYCPEGAIFSLSLASHVVVGAAAAPIAARSRLFARSASAPSSGPTPERLGYSAAQVPRPTGPAAAGIARAVQFARPSTALALGARAPSRPPPAPGADNPALGERSTALPAAPPPAPPARRGDAFGAGGSWRHGGLGVGSGRRSHR